jgi:hypothetical protein
MELNEHLLHAWESMTDPAVIRRRIDELAESAQKPVEVVLHALVVTSGSFDSALEFMRKSVTARCGSLATLLAVRLCC